jgi:formylglycine-generating enzyme required for sulfatase activity
MLKIFIICTFFTAQTLFMLISSSIAIENKTKSNQEPSTVWVEPNTGMEFVWIPPGCFIMGSNSTEASYSERPAHKVCLDGFWMGRFEVTNKQYRAFKPEHDSGIFETVSLNEEQQPVVNESWEMARAFARWLSEKNRKQFDLPSEAQWEYAARGGTTSLWYFGDASPCLFENIADLSLKKLQPGKSVAGCDDGYPASAPVGSFRPNPFGLYDILGNVSEKCLDGYRPQAYKHHSLNNPLVNDDAEDRIGRGSCFDCALKDNTTTFRAQTSIDDIMWYSGFRLIREK